MNQPTLSKAKFARSAAISAARDLVLSLQPCCERLIVAGSLRRRKSEVGDIEILYIPKFATERDGLFDTKQINLVDRQLETMLASRSLEKRINSLGSETWGERNKLARHSSGIPVDLFEATATNWFNYLVCRTGSASNNVRIASAAELKGWKWHPYDAGFTDEEGRPVPVESEQDVYRLAGLPYLEPWQR